MQWQGGVPGGAKQREEMAGENLRERACGSSPRAVDWTEKADNNFSQ